MICLKEDCQKYLIPQCSICIDEHPEHSNKYIKNIDKSCETLHQEIKSQNSQNQSQGTEQEKQHLMTLAKSFKLLSEHLHQISEKIFSNLDKVCQNKENVSNQQNDILNIIEQIKSQQHQQSNNAQKLFEPLRNFIKFDENKKQIALKEVQKQQQPIENTLKSYKLYLQQKYDSLLEQINYLINNNEIELLIKNQQSQIVKFSQELKHPNLQVKQNGLVVKLNQIHTNAIILSENPLSQSENTKWKIKIIKKIKDTISFGVINKEYAVSQSFSFSCGQLQIVSTHNPYLDTGDILEIEYSPSEQKLFYSKNSENQKYNKDISQKQNLHAAFHSFYGGESYELIQ